MACVIEKVRLDNLTVPPHLKLNESIKTTLLSGSVKMPNIKEMRKLIFLQFQAN